MTDRRHPLHPRVLGIVALVAGLILVGVALTVLDKDLSWGELFYDLGIGVLIAAAVAVGVDAVTRRFERHQAELEAARRLEIEQVREEAQRRQEAIDAHWAQLEAAVRELGRGLDAANLNLDLGLLKAAVDHLAIEANASLSELVENVKETRRRVDPDYARFLDATEGS
jgi:hypothetical protein